MVSGNGIYVFIIMGVTPSRTFGYFGKYMVWKETNVVANSQNGHSKETKDLFIIKKVHDI
jgi:hypothetical protein